MKSPLQNSLPEARNPWAYVPLLYFMQAIPVTLVQEVTSLVYKDLGIGNESITRWTSIIAIPWSLQFLFGPLVDLNGTKRNWTLIGQAVMAALLALAAISFKLPHPFTISLGIFLVTAIFSVLCNVATDGFYLLSLSHEGQAAFSGIQTTAYRLGMLFCKGGLVVLAGLLLTRFHMETMASWTVAFLVGSMVFALGWAMNLFALPAPPSDGPRSRIEGESPQLVFRQTGVVLAFGLSAYFAASSVVKLAAEALWFHFDGTLTGPLHGWRMPPLASYFGYVAPVTSVSAEIWQLEVCLAVAFVTYAYGRKIIRATSLGDAFGSYFSQKKIVWILAFLMFYRFSEAMVTKMAVLFLKDKPAVGGMGFSTTEIGTISGVFGVAGIVAGGLLGGFIVSRFGLKRSIVPIAILMNLPNFLYLWAAFVHPGFYSMAAVHFTEQLGYGFGFAGYLVFQMRVARQGGYATTHYALGVGIGAMFIQVAGILSGILQANFGYKGFFIAALFLALPGLVTLFFVPLDEGNMAVAR